MIEFDKTRDQLATCQKDLIDTVSKLHTTNKARHETEIRLGEAMEKQKIDSEALKLKDEMITRKNNDCEEYDKRIVELMRTNESLDTKKQGIERQFELTKKQLNEKINNLNEIINGEKETREMWIERYEKEQKEHNITNAQLLVTKSDHRDQLLATKNAEIKLNTMTRQVELLSKQNSKFQESLNETVAKNEVMERDLNTLKEVLKQIEISKKEYVAKLKHELDTVESRFLKVINENNMVGEDYRSMAV